MRLPLRPLAFALVLAAPLAGCAPRALAPESGRASAPALAGALVMPVAGVRPTDLRDTFTAPRSGGRTHHALDVMAPRGTPVVAAAPGRVRRIHTSALGGRTVYVLAADERTVYYYAHLDAYARGLEEGQRLRAGDAIGRVGSTGNASTPHLHFAIWRSPYADGFWKGEPVNPYPLLRRSASREAEPGLAARPESARAGTRRTSPPEAAPRRAPPDARPVRRGW